jgi:hypothetical protein
MQETEYYNIKRETVKNIANQMFNTSPEAERWGKDRLMSVKLLSDAFNSYLDVAEQTLNFTQMQNLSEEKKTVLKVAMAKNLLFILEAVDENELSIQDVFTALAAV